MHLRSSIPWFVALLILPSVARGQMPATLTHGQISFIELTYTTTNPTKPWNDRINDETQGVFYDAAAPVSLTDPYMFNAAGGAIIRVAGTQHLFQRPPTSDWNFIGVPGSALFRATPQNGDPASRLILGISTLGVPNIFVGNSINIKMSVAGITNPGEFSYYKNDDGFNDPLGILFPPPKFSTLENITDLLFDTGTQNNFNMAFSAPGIYNIDFQFSGTLQAGGTTTSPFYRYTFDVAAFAVPEPATWGLIGASVLAAGGYGWTLRRRRQLLLDTPLPE